MAGTGTAHLRPPADALLRVEDLVVEYDAGRGGTVHAVSGVSFDILPGETLGMVGESGCGKSTAARAVLQVPRPTGGSVVFEGRELTSLDGEDLRRIRPLIQMIFQDPISSLNPRRHVDDIVAEGLAIWAGDVDAATRAQRTAEVLEAVGLDPPTVAKRRAHQLSGGQCQRICVARALVLEPRLLVCDEPVSALDVSVQAQILNLLEEMKARYGLTLLFIAHDLAVVKNISDRIIVLYMGKVCEVAGPDDLFAHPKHPYTKLLLDTVPHLDERTHPLAGAVGDEDTDEPPSPLDPPSGCRFRTRCPRADARCSTDEPILRQLRPGHFAACHHPFDQ